jgi:hypothetical protein
MHFDTSDLPAPPRDSYHWTLARQRAFLEHFAISGCVSDAAHHVGVSPRAAYALRHRRDGVLFALGWQAALLLARHRLADALLERALAGQQDVSVRILDRDTDTIEVRRQRTDNRLGLTLLARLDRMAGAGDAPTGSAREMEIVRLIAQDFEAFLDHLAPSDGVLDGPANPAACQQTVQDQFTDAIVGVVAMLTTALEATHPLQQLLRKAPIHCELAQNFAKNPDAIDPAETEARDHARSLGVWYDGATGRLQTNFPPPDDFTGTAIGTFVLSEGYARDLTAWEAAIVTQRVSQVEHQFRSAATEARERWFNIPDPAAAGTTPAPAAPLPTYRPTPAVHLAPAAKPAIAPEPPRRARETLDESIARIRARIQEDAEAQARADSEERTGLAATEGALATGWQHDITR